MSPARKLPNSMETTFECPICTEIYNCTERRPKALPCGHTVCLSDLQALLRTHKALACPFDTQVSEVAPEQLPDNHAILNLLDSMETRCWTHNAVADSFCPVHTVPLCENCEHSSECPSKLLPKDFVEVSHLVMDALSSAFEAAKSEVEDDTKRLIQKRYNNLLRVNLSLLRQLHEQQRKKSCLPCEECERIADGGLVLTTFQSYCQTHMTMGWRSEEYIFPLQGTNQVQICEEMEKLLPLILKKVNFYDLDQDTLRKLAAVPTVPQELQKLGKVLISLITNAKGSFENAPDIFYCPECFSQTEKSSARITIMPCFEAYHAICSQCAAQKQTQRSIACPLDGSVFSISVEKLQTIPAIRPKNRPKFDISGELKPFPLKPVVFKSAVGGLPPQIGEILGQLPEQLDMKERSDLLVPKSAKVAASPMPPANSSQGVFTLDRFPSVLPPISVPMSRLTPNQCGWKHVAGVGQVEAVVFTTTESVTLVGLGLGTPIDVNQAAILISVRFYRGECAVGSPLLSIKANQRIESGPNVMFPVHLSPPLAVSPFQKYTLKIQFQGDPDQDFDMFKGNQYEKPEIWCGDDGTIWEFEECITVERSEYLNGQNNLSGPILRLMYRR